MNRIHNAAIKIQKYIRGQQTRKYILQEEGAYLFFKKVHRIVSVRSLVYSMKQAYLNVQNTKKRYLKKYIFHCATKI